MLLARQDEGQDRTCSWLEDNPLTHLADRLDAGASPSSLMACRRRALHPFGLDGRGGAGNVAIRSAPLALAALVVLLVGGSRFGYEACLLVVASVLLALTGLQADAPVLTDKFAAAINRWPVPVAVLSAACLVLSLVMLVMTPPASPLRVSAQLMTLFVLCASRQLLSIPLTGALRRRHLWRVLGVILTQLIVLFVAWTFVVLLNFYDPPKDADALGETVRWMLGTGLLAAGYVVAVGRRRQKLYARLISAIDVLAMDLNSSRMRRTPDRIDVTGHLLALDRLLGTSLDLAASPFSITFESAGLRTALRAVAIKALHLNDLRLSSGSERQEVITAIIDRWSVTDCRRHLENYLVALRHQLSPSEDALAVG
jgi:hypothetical protein